MNNSERILLFVLVGIIAIGAVLVLVLEYNRRAKALARERDDLELQRVEADELLSQRDEWIEKGRWISKAQLPFKSQREADSDIIDSIDSSAKKAEVEVRQRNLLEPDQTEQYNQAGANVSGYGKLPDVLGWLYAMQSPEKFRAVSQVKLEPDPKNPEKIIAQFQLLRWYRPIDSE